MKLRDHAFAIKENEDEKVNTNNLPKSDEHNCEGSACSPKF